MQLLKQDYLLLMEVTSEMLHLLDYVREAIGVNQHSNMTVCGLIVSDEFITVDPDSEFKNSICITCSQLQFRRDEPEDEVGIPDVYEQGSSGVTSVKQERYGD